jgi:hypothetical protein
MIEARHTSDIKAVRSHVGADTERDNCLMRVKIKRRFQRSNGVKGEKKTKFDKEKFEEIPTVATYEERITGELILEEEFIERKWRNIKTVISGTA